MDALTRTDRESQRQASLHEAGHAVIARLLGFRVVAVRLISKRDQLGEAVTGPSTQAYRSGIFEARQVYPEIEAALQIMISIAGRLAEELLSPGKLFLSYRADREDVVDLLAEIGHEPGSEQGQRILSVLIPLCRKYVAMHAVQIEALAEALLAHGKIIRQREITEMLRPRTMPVRAVIAEVMDALVVDASRCGAR